MLSWTVLIRRNNFLVTLNQYASNMVYYSSFQQSSQVWHEIRRSCQHCPNLSFDFRTWNLWSLVLKLLWFKERVSPQLQIYTVMIIRGHNWLFVHSRSGVSNSNPLKGHPLLEKSLQAARNTSDGPRVWDPCSRQICPWNLLLWTPLLSYLCLFDIFIHRYFACLLLRLSIPVQVTFFI